MRGIVKAKPKPMGWRRMSALQFEVPTRPITRIHEVGVPCIFSLGFLCLSRRLSRLADFCRASSSSLGFAEMRIDEQRRMK